MRNLFVIVFCFLTISAFSQTTPTKEKKAATADSVQQKEIAQAPLPPTFKGQPLFFLDGKPVANIDKINVESLSSVEIISDSTALAAYGEAGKYGVILMHSKNATPSISTSPVSVRDRDKEKNN